MPRKQRLHQPPTLTDSHAGAYRKARFSARWNLRRVYNVRAEFDSAVAGGARSWGRPKLTAMPITSCRRTMRCGRRVYCPPGSPRSCRSLARSFCVHSGGLWRCDCAPLNYPSEKLQHALHIRWPAGSRNVRSSGLKLFQRADLGQLFYTTVQLKLIAMCVLSSGSPWSSAKEA
jgi:hypothetical protein